MTLDEYMLAGSRDSFTYWIESRLDELGSIWGGSAFKFGVFSRRDTKVRESAENRSYSDTHGWCNRPRPGRLATNHAGQAARGYGYSGIRAAGV